MRRLARLTLVFVSVATFAIAGRARADESCVACHATRSEQRLRAPVASRAHDVHADAGVGCTDCHGGDPDEPSVRAHDLGRGFRGVPDALGTLQVCGHCHDGSREGLDDVASEVRAGRHGRAAAAGRPTATCTSCHGAHGIVPHEQPSSPVSAQHVVDTCAACHSDPARMAESGLPTDQAAQWRVSVHAEVFAADPDRAPSCATCHGPHDNAAGLAAVAACAQCHAPIRAAFDQGPHAQRFQSLGFLDCAECHGSHEIRRADASLLEGLGAACARCHGPGQEVFARVRRIEALGGRLDAARGSLTRADPRRVAIVLALHSLDVEALEAALDAVPSAESATPPSGGAVLTDWLPGVALVLVLLAIAFVWRRRKR